MSKFKIPNPFDLIRVFNQKNTNTDIIKDSETNEEKTKKTRKKGIDLDEEFKELGFEFIKIKDKYRVYKYVAIPTLFLFWNTEISDISLYYDKKLLSKINFVPNNRIFIENLIKKTIENI